MTRKTTNPRDKLIQVRVSQEEMNRINEAAKQAGLDRSAYVRYASIAMTYTPRSQAMKKPKPKGKPPKGC